MLTPDHSNFARKDWTPARCSRLLRQIIVPLAALRRLHTESKAPTKSKVDEAESDVTAARLQDCVAAASPQDVGIRAKNLLDPDWFPQDDQHLFKRPNRKQYSKTRVPLKSSIRTCADAGVDFDTPQLRRIAISQVESTPSWTPASVKNCEEKSKRTKRFEAFIAPSDARVLQLYKLKCGMRELLRITDHDSSGTSNPSGCPSLTSMCLRSVPKLIHLEEQAQQFAAKTDQSDVVASMYEYLEESYGMSSRGWKQLRIVAREQGIQMVVGAAKDGVIPPELVQDLGHQLLRQGNDPTNGRQARRDAVTLLQAAGFATNLSPSCLSDERIQDPGNLRSLVRNTSEWSARDRRGFRCEVMARMLMNESLRVEHILSASTHHLWKSAIVGLHADDVAGDSAALFLRSVVLAACGLHQQHTDGQLTPPDKFIKPLPIIRKALTTILTTLSALSLSCQHSGADTITAQKLAAKRSRAILLDVTTQAVQLHCVSSGQLDNMRSKAVWHQAKTSIKMVVDTTFLTTALQRVRGEDAGTEHLSRMLLLSRSLDSDNNALGPIQRQLRLIKGLARALDRMHGLHISDSVKPLTDDIRGLSEAICAEDKLLAIHLRSLVDAMLTPPSSDSLPASHSPSKHSCSGSHPEHQMKEKQHLKRLPVRRKPSKYIWEEDEVKDKVMIREDSISFDSSAVETESEASLASENESDGSMVDSNPPEHTPQPRPNADSPKVLSSSKRLPLREKDSNAILKGYASSINTFWAMPINAIEEKTIPRVQSQKRGYDMYVTTNETVRRSEGSLSPHRPFQDDYVDEAEWSFASTSSDSSTTEIYKRRRLDNKKRSMSLFSSLSRRGTGGRLDSDEMSNVDELSLMAI